MHGPVSTLMRMFLFTSLVVSALSTLDCGPTSPASSSATAAASQSISTTRALQRLFRASQADSSWFAPSFLVDTPLDQVQALLDVVHETLGDFQGALGGGEDFVVRFSAGQKSVRAKLDDAGRFVVLLVGPG
jgi:hypothetical protein